MVQRRNKDIEIVRNFRKSLKNISISKFFLFGSRAKGTAYKDSDFDILVVSKDFEGKRWNKRSLDIYLSWKVDYPVEFLCYTPKEFEELKDRPTIVREAVKEGIEI